MKMVRIFADNFDDAMQQLIQHFNALSTSDNGKNVPKRAKERDAIDSSLDISKVFWVNRHSIKNEDADIETVILEFNMIAPFAIKDSIKATISKNDDEQLLKVTYTNDYKQFNDIERINFKLDNDVSYVYSFKDYKVNKKKVNMSYDNGIIKITVPVTKETAKSSEFVIKL